jgi:hypothetical protein
VRSMMLPCLLIPLRARNVAPKRFGVCGTGNLKTSNVIGGFWATAIANHAAGSPTVQTGSMLTVGKTRLASERAYHRVLAEGHGPTRPGDRCFKPLRLDPCLPLHRALQRRQSLLGFRGC